jgi:hypothetical protein
MRLLSSLLVWVVVLVGIYWIFAAGGLQYLQDQYFLATYHPPAEIAALASEDGMHGKGLTSFYESNPQIVDSPTIQQHCPGGAGIEVFGCYDGRTIYVLDIANPQLKSQMGTAAAHEMLHAAYSRLSKSEKSRIDPQIDAEVSGCQQRMSGINLDSRLADYSQSEPGQRDNELHSIIGTECTDLGDSLETYYAQYFTNRAQMVGLSSHYNDVFLTARQGLENDKSKYLQCIAGLNGLQRQIGQLESQMNTARSSGDTSSYNSLVPQHNSLVDEYNGQRSICVAEQNRYNGAVDQYNSLIGSQ